MVAENHQKLADRIWAVANKLRGPYRPPQYRKVMLPLIVLRRLDCLLEPTKDHVLKQYQALKARKLSPEATEKALARVASKNRKQPLFNISPYTFTKLLGESSAIAKNLTPTSRASRRRFARFSSVLNLKPKSRSLMKTTCSLKSSKSSQRSICTRTRCPIWRWVIYLNT